VRHAFVRTLHRICGRVDGTFRVCAGDSEIAIERHERLPLLLLARAAQADGPFGLDPHVSLGDRTAYLALWSYARSLPHTLDRLPAELHPQLAVATPAGTALIWVPQPPYPIEGDAGGPDVQALLVAIADALDAVPPGATDLIPLPRANEDLGPASDTTHADPAALWSWSQRVLEDRRRADAVRAEAMTTADRARRVTREVNGHRPDVLTDAETDRGLGTDEWADEYDDADGPAGGLPPLVAVSPLEAAPARQESALHPLPGTPQAVRTAEAPVSATHVGRGALRRVTHALADRMGCSHEAAMSRALLLHAMATLGTERVYTLLGVELTWMKPDGLYGLANGAWSKIA